MNTRFLTALQAISETGSIAAAARKLGLAANTVREQIQALEQEFGAALLSRSGRNMELTASGEAVALASGEILDRVRDLRQVAQLDQLRGRLRVGVISTVMIGILPAVLRLMGTQHPEIELRIMPGTGVQLYQMLDAREIDCAIMARPPFKLPKTFSWLPVKEYPLILLGSEAMMIGSNDEILRSQPFIRIDRRVWTGQIVTAYLRQRDIDIAEIVEIDGLEAIVMLVSQGLGVALLPDWGFVALTGSTLVRRPVGDPSFNRVTGLLGVVGARQKLTEALGRTLLAAVT